MPKKLIKVLVTGFVLLAYFVAFSAITVQSVISDIIRLDEMEQSSSSSDIFVFINYESNPLYLADKLAAIESLDQLSQRLINPGVYTYYNINRQPLFNLQNTSDFFDVTGELSTGENGVLCVQIGQNVQSDFNISLMEGALLSAEDYSYDGKRVIPILMGYDYSDIYDIGERFRFEYLFYTYTFEVKGFLADNNIINTPPNGINLNKFIVMPCIDFDYIPQSETEVVSQLIHNTNKTSGVIKVDNSKFQEAQEYFLPLLEDFGQITYSWYTNSSIINYLRIGLDLNLLSPVCIITAFAMILTATVMMVLILGRTIRKQAVSRKQSLKYSVKWIRKAILIIAIPSISSYLAMKVIFLYHGIKANTFNSTITAIVIALALIIYAFIYNRVKMQIKCER